MSTTYTPNYNLGKQTDVNDLFSMSVITGNMDKIDTQMKKAENLYTVDFINGTDLSLSNVVWMKKIPNASTGVPESSATRICTDKLDILISTRSIVITFDDTDYKIAFYTYDGSTSKRRQYWFTSSPFTIPISKDEKQLIIGLAYKSNANIDTSKKTAVTGVHFNIDTSQLYISASNINFVKGSLNPGTGTEYDPSNYRLRSDYIFLPKGSKIVGYNATATVGSIAGELIVYEYNTDYSYRSDSAWADGNEYTVTADGFVRILIRKTDESIINDADIPTLLKSVVICPSYPINTLSKIMKGPYIPSYYDTIDSSISSIKENDRGVGVNGITFAFVTDLHWENNVRNVDSLLSYVKDNCPVKYMIVGGDIINGAVHDTAVKYMSDCMDRLYDVGFDTFCIYGNHDDNSIPSGQTLITDAEFYSIAESRMPNGTVYGDYSYFYYDDTKTKTRFIFLDSQTEGEPLSTAQGDFLDSALSSTPTGWHIIVVWHIIYQPVNGTTWETVPLDLAPTGFSNSVFTKLDTHNSGGTSKVEAIIGGHVHSDWNFTTTGGIPIILTTTAGLKALNGDTATRGTTTETAFDVITIDYDNEVIKCVRIGRGSSRTITY